GRTCVLYWTYERHRVASREEVAMSVVEDHRTAQEVVADLRAAGARETTSVEVEAAEAAFTAWEAEMASSPAPGRDPVLCAMLSAGVPEEWATQLTQTVHAC